jgi:holo-[acyl-carrier protein] synthase
MVEGLGIDLIEVSRVERAVERHPRLANRLFTDAELRYARARARPGRHLAARFAAKEAVVKALGMDGAFALGEVEVVAGEPPAVKLRGRAAQAARSQGVELRVSLSHSREHAAAVAIAERR